MPESQDPKKSKYTEDRKIPGAFEGETVSRRRFMTLTANGAGGLAVAAFALPSLGFAAGSAIFERPRVDWAPVGAPEEFPTDTYVPKVVTTVFGIGAGRRSPHRVREQAAFAAQLGGQALERLHAQKTSAKAAAAASTVRSTCSEVWASEGNHASNWDGGA